MAVPAVLTPRVASEEDRSSLANLLHFETYVHRHLDWRRPLDWLGQDPYFVLENNGRLVAALAAPPDPPGVAWIRLFASSLRFDAAEAWALLWPQALARLRELEVAQVAAIPLHDWFLAILGNSQFAHAYNVVVLEWRPGKESAAAQLATGFSIRPMNSADVPAVFLVDHNAFAPLWQHSEKAVAAAFKQAGFATVIEKDGEVIAFQISTRSAYGLHLARLATHKSYQGMGLAAALVSDVQSHVVQKKDAVLSVNTQDINRPSLALYEKMGFALTGERFPVYQFEVN